jgi:hypothetical protein
LDGLRPFLTGDTNAHMRLLNHTDVICAITNRESNPVPLLTHKLHDVHLLCRAYTTADCGRRKEPEPEEVLFQLVIPCEDKGKRRALNDNADWSRLFLLFFVELFERLPTEPVVLNFLLNSVAKGLRLIIGLIIGDVEFDWVVHHDELTASPDFNGGFLLVACEYPDSHVCLGKLGDSVGYAFL